MHHLVLATLTGLFIALMTPGCTDDTSSNEAETDLQADSAADSNTDSEADSDSDTGAWSGPGSGFCDFGFDAKQLRFGDVAGIDVEETEISAGVEVCADTSAHRYAAVSCESEYAPPLCDTCNGGAGCAEGEICHDHWDMCFCYRPCMSDDDCDADEACLCGMHSAVSFGPYGFTNSIPRCLPADCRTDEDCGDFRCGVSLDGCGGFAGLYCHTAEDPCEGAEQCQAEALENESFTHGCNYATEDESFACMSYNYCE